VLLKETITTIAHAYSPAYNQPQTVCDMNMSDISSHVVCWEEMC